MAIFDDAYTAVMLTQPFFGQLLTKFKVEPTERFPTLAVSLDTLFYNPTFIESISDDECIAAITHEVMHGMFAHLVEMDMYHESGIGPDGKPYEQDKYNRAADYVINDLIKQNNIGTIGAGWCWDAAYPHTMTPAEIYEVLPSDPPSGGGKGKGAGQQSHDTHVSDGAAGNQKQNAIQPQDVQSAFETAKALGHVPAGIERLIGSIIRPKHSPWAMLRQAVISAMRGHDTTTWRRLNRHMMSRGVVMPGRTGFACGRVGVVVDTSGSIGDELLQLFANHMGAILSDAKPREIKVYWTDAKVHRVDTVKSGQDLRRAVEKPVGGGGTDMECGIKAAGADGCDIVVVLTDGHTPFTKGPKRPVIWAMTTDVQAPYGRTIKIC